MWHLSSYDNKLILKIGNKTNTVSQIPNTWKHIVPFTGVLSSIPCELIHAKNSIMLRRRKKPFIVASVFHHDNDCACVSLINSLFVLRSNNVEHMSKNIVSQVITKSLRFHTNKKNFFHRLKVTQSSLTVFGWVLSFAELCLIRNFVWQKLCLEFSKSGLPWLPSHQREIQH